MPDDAGQKYLDLLNRQHKQAQELRYREQLEQRIKALEEAVFPKPKAKPTSKGKE